MADRECASYEATLAGANNGGPGQHQKATSTTIQLPSLTSKHQQAMKDSSGQQDDSPQSGGYYLNVAQKGKLILPTALWILLIVAGVSFLTLLATLNRTVDTLDTLIELEQEKEAHQERLHHLQHVLDEHHSRRYQADEESPQRSRHSQKESRRFHELDSSDNNEPMKKASSSVSSSWFSLPNWVSLEPSSHDPFMQTIDSQARPMSANQRHHDHQSVASISSGGNQLVPPQFESLMDDMVRQMMGPADRQMVGSVPEISGSFIISSSSDGANLQPSNGNAERPAELLDSILEQAMPMLSESFKSGPIELKEPLKSSQPVEPPVQQGPMISAKIENLNINLGGSNDMANTGNEQHAPKKVDMPTKERNDIDDFEKTIDSVMSKLLSRKETRAPTIEVAGDEARPLVEPYELVRIGGKSDEPTKATRDSNDSLMNDFIGSMFTLPQFGSSNNQQEIGGNSGSSSGSSSSGGSSSSSAPVLLETTTPVSVVQVTTTTTTTKTSSSSSAETSTPNPIDIAADIAETQSKAETLPSDPLLKGFLGLTESEPFFVKEEVNLLPATTISASPMTTQKPLQSSSEAPTTESSVTVSPSTTSASVTQKPTPTSQDVQEWSTTRQPTTTKQPTSFAEVIRADEAPIDFPIIDLAPFAKSSAPTADESKQKLVAAIKIDDLESSPPAPTTPPTILSTASRPIDTINSSGGSRTSIAPTATSNHQTTSNGTQQATKTTTATIFTTTTAPAQNSNHSAGKPTRSFLEKADDFIERNLVNLKRLF